MPKENVNAMPRDAARRLCVAGFIFQRFFYFRSRIQLMEARERSTQTGATDNGLYGRTDNGFFVGCACCQMKRKWVASCFECSRWRFSDELNRSLSWHLTWNFYWPARNSCTPLLKEQRRIGSINCSHSGDINQTWLFNLLRSFRWWHSAWATLMNWPWTKKKNDTRTSYRHFVSHFYLITREPRSAHEHTSTSSSQSQRFVTCTRSGQDCRMRNAYDEWM